MPRKEPGFAERLQMAAKAKQAQSERIRATELANDDSSSAGRQVRIETAEARLSRAAERKQANRVIGEQKAAQYAAEKTRQALAATEEKARKELERAAQIAADAKLKKDQKTARDSKYAARKDRQK